MIASLGMYERPETSGANASLWALIRDGLRARDLPAPEELTQGQAAYWPAWQDPELLLSQTCGLPFRAGLHRTVTLVGTPDYGVQGCAPGYYRSVLIRRHNDPRVTEAAFSEARLAINDAFSQSGWAAVYQHFQALRLAIPPAMVTGSHRASAWAVYQGQADFAAIDAVTWELLKRHEAFASTLRVFAQTTPTPGLPLITARADLADTLFEVIAAAIAGLSNEERHTLCVRGLVRIPESRYLALPLPPAPAQFGGTI